MPIDGVTTNPTAAYPRLGELRKGSPKKQIWSEKYQKKVWVAGDDLDHFRFTCDNPKVVARFQEVYGNEPREINAFLPFGTKDENFDAWMKKYGSGGLKIKCTRPEDREGGIVLWQDDTGMFQTTPKTCQWPNCECVPTGVLTIIIPELVPVGGIGAVWVLTKSWNDCVELGRNLTAAEITAKSLGMSLIGIPFILSRRPSDVSCPPRKGSNGKRARDEKWMLHIEPRPDWVVEQMEASRQLASPMNAPRLAAPPSELSPFDEIFVGDSEGEIEYPDTEVLGEESVALPANGNGDESAKLAFFERVLSKIKYYSTTEEIAAVLKEHNCKKYAKSREDWMWDVLEAHAKAKADEEAAGA